jgi:hypothetical protein
MAIQNERDVINNLEGLRCKVDLLEDKIRCQQLLIDGLRQQMSSIPLVQLPALIYASTSRETKFAREWGAPLMVAIAVVTVIGVVAFGLWGK